MDKAAMPGDSGKLWIAIVGILCLLFTISLSRSITKLYKAQGKIDEIQGKIDQLKKDNEDLNKQIDAVAQGSYIEEQLRDKLGLAKEGDIVIMMPSPEIVRKFAPDYPEEKPTLPEPNWKKWVKLFWDK